jgi:hypothetical protein
MKTETITFRNRDRTVARATCGALQGYALADLLASLPKESLTVEAGYK